MAESKAIAARVHPNVHEWLKEEAEKRGTTLGSYIEEILRGHYQSHQVPEGEPGDVGTDEPEKIAVRSVETPENKESIAAEAGSREKANEIRAELSEFVDDDLDDRRQTVVYLDPSARDELVARGEEA